MLALVLSLRFVGAHGMSSFLGAAHQQLQSNPGLAATSSRILEQDIDDEVTDLEVSHDAEDKPDDSWLLSLQNASSSQVGEAFNASALIRVLGTNLSDGFPKAFGDCALIGSSAILNNSRRGSEIDTYGTVIRVNRVPTKDYYLDFGKKTDIVILNKKLSINKTIEHLGDEHLRQGFQCDTTEKQCSNFSVIINTIDRGWQREWIRQVWARAPIPIGEISPLPHLVADDLPSMKRTVPSTGFKAFLAFASMCDKLTLYGFGGGMKTADGHKVEVALGGEHHDFEAENLIIDKIANGTMRNKDWGLNKTSMALNIDHANIRYAYVRELTGRDLNIKAIRD